MLTARSLRFGLYEQIKAAPVREGEEKKKKGMSSTEQPKPSTVEDATPINDRADGRHQRLIPVCLVRVNELSVCILSVSVPRRQHSECAKSQNELCTAIDTKINC